MSESAVLSAAERPDLEVQGRLGLLPPRRLADARDHTGRLQAAAAEDDPVQDQRRLGILAVQVSVGRQKVVS